MKPILKGIMAGFIALAGSLHAQKVVQHDNEPGWRAQAAADVPRAADNSNAAGLAISLKDQIIVWTDPSGPKIASEVNLVVDAPYAKVQPAVQQALTSFGQFEAHEENIPIAYEPEGWDEVLLSRRADLRDALATKFVQPSLDQALREGTLTAAEVSQRMVTARADTSSVPQNRITLDAFRTTYASYAASLKQSYGLLRKSQSELSVTVFDVSAVFGHPATAVRISRNDIYPNPDYSALKAIRQFNPLSNPLPATLNSHVVPAPVFNAVRVALESVGQGQPVRIARTPLAWAIDNSKSSATATANIVLTPAADLQPPAAAEALPWTSISALSEDAIQHPYSLLTLSDGDVLLSADGYFSVEGRLSSQTHIWRLHGDGHAWKAHSIWQGDHGARQMAISADGSMVWFSGAVAGNQADQLFSCDVVTERVTAYTANFVGSDPSKDGSAGWELSGNQLPTYFAFDLSAKYTSPAGRDLFKAFQPTDRPPAAGGAWTFRATMKSARQSMMNAQMQGNTLIKPVRWRGTNTFWTEDQIGVAELNVADGHLLRAFALPQRFGTPDPKDVTGAAQWVPTPLGSPEGNWIATGFVLMLSDDGKMPPSLEGNPNRNDRFVGMHVVDLKDGHVRLSALLGRADTLQAAARSAHGRLLALGSNDTTTGDPRVALWDVTGSQVPLQLASPLRGELNALAFSWSGTELWAFGNRGLMHWHLPVALTDAADRGSFPDQSQN
jgi:hypothetical protein